MIALLFLRPPFFFILFLLLPTQISWAGSSHLAATHISNGGYGLLRDGKIVAGQNLDTLFTPASTIKLLTSLAALSILGKKYRFSSRFYQDSQKNLFIQGNGDPFLVSEKIVLLLNVLKEQGISEVNNLILDDSFFAIKGPPEGSVNSTNPYDVPNSALGVNFNSISIRVSKAGVISSGERQTPNLPIMQELGKHLSPGLHRINVNAYPLGSDLSNTLRYTGELFVALMVQEGIKFSGTIIHGRVTKNSRPVLSYHGDKTLAELISACLKYSNNFISNQLFLACGVNKFGEPATWEKSRKTLRTFSKKNLNLTEAELVIREGSGLSRKNQVSPRAMLQILLHFLPHHHLMSQKHGVLMKTGTLKRVYCYAGYYRKNERFDPFVILLNQKDNKRDTILRILEKK